MGNMEFAQMGPQQQQQQQTRMAFQPQMQTAQQPQAQFFNAPGMDTMMSPPMMTNRAAPEMPSTMSFMPNPPSQAGMMSPSMMMNRAAPEMPSTMSFMPNPPSQAGMMSPSMMMSRTAPEMPTFGGQVLNKQQSVQTQQRSAQDSNSLAGFCVGRQPDDRIPHPTKPNMFIVCHASELFDVMNCPSGLVFNLNTLNCETSFNAPKGCSSNPCQNGGTCTDLPSFLYKCGCPTGFGGDRCEKSDSCSTVNCGSNSFCISLPIGSPVSYYCLCQNGMSYGLDCQTRVEANPCMPNEADLASFASITNAAVFVQCDGHIPHLKFCNYPLIFSAAKQQCDWQ